MTIESLTEETVRSINNGEELEDAIGRALIEWGLHNIEIELTQANRILAAIENPSIVAHFTWRRVDGHWHAYHLGLHCCVDIGEWAKPYVFNSQAEAVEWILNNVNDYGAKDWAARFGGALG